jgi:RNA polymerase sigma-70 factor (ECF subfamily)
MEVQCGTMETVWSNERWLSELQAENDVAWATLRGRIVRGLRAYLGGRGTQALDTPTLVDDVAQEALLTVRSKLGGFRGDSRFTTWVYRIAVNVLLGELRRRRWDAMRPAQPHDQAPLWPLEEVAAGPERQTRQREAWNLVRSLIEGALTPYQRQVLLAHVFDEKPLDLVAGDLGVSRDAVYKAIHDARRKLRGELLARGITLGELTEVFGP